MKIRDAGPSWTKQIRSRGNVHVYEHPKYGMIMRRWPRVWNSDKTAKQLLNIAQFKQAVEWARWPLPEEYYVALQQAPGSPLLPRDILEKNVYGTLITAYTSDGGVIMGIRIAVPEVQTLLDAITTENGAMLVRSPSGWIALSAGASGQVLASNGPLTVPTYQYPSPTGVGDSNTPTVNNASAFTASTSAFAFKGISVYAQDDVVISEVWGWINITAGQEYAGFVGELSGSGSTPTLTSAELTQVETAGLTASASWLGAKFATPVQLSKGNYYSIMFGRVDGATNFALPINSPATNATPWPCPLIVHQLNRIASVSPAIGNSPDTNSGAVPGTTIGVVWSRPL